MRYSQPEKKCAVFGANGYLGKHLSIYLQKMHFNVLNYDIHPDSKLNNYSQLDITNIDQFRKLSNDISYIFYFAGITGTHSGFTEHMKFININEVGLLNMLTYLIRNNLRPRFIFPSTRLVYKGVDHPLKEEDEKDAKTIYAVNKIAAEYYLKIYNNRFGIPFNVFRICVPYGNTVDGNYSFGTIGFFLGKATKGENIILFGDGKIKRTFTYVDDICRQIYTVIKDINTVNEIYNIAGETYTLSEVANMIAYRFGVSVEYIDWIKEDALIESGHTYFNGQKISKLIKRPVKTKLNDWIKNI